VHKRTTSIFIFVFSILAITSATAATDIAYILEDSTPLSDNVLNEINSLGLTYDVIRDSEILGTDFSDYSVLLVTEEINNQHFLPFDEKHSLFLDRDTAVEVWPESQTSFTTNAKFVEVVDSTHDVFNGVDIPVGGIISLYGGSGFEMHYLRVKPVYVDSLAIRTTANRPVIAVSTRQIGAYLVRNIFLGAANTNEWNSNSKLIFKNSLIFLLADVDQDEDGWLFEDDCDDQDPDAYPGAPEVPYDMIDQDCNGYDLLDVDNDGYCAEGYFIQSPLFQCALDQSLTGADCDDNDDLINPDNPDLTLNCINDAPTITSAPTSLTASEGDLVEFDVFADDPENDNLIFDIDHTDFVINGNHYSWQTDYYDSGIHLFEITVSDSEFSVTQNIEIEIFDSNMPPVSIQIPPQSWPEDSSHLIDVSAYFYDDDSSDLEYGIDEISDESVIEAVFETDETVRITPAGDYSGQEWIVFYADDGEDRTLSNQVLLNITNVNDPVTFETTIPDQEMNEDIPLEDEFNLYNHFNDIDSDLVFEAFGNVDVEITVEDGWVSFYPSEDFFGTEQIYFTATDEDATATSNIFTLTVIEQGEPPEFLPLTCETTIEEDISHTCTLEATDFEGDDLAFSVDSMSDLICEVTDNVLTYVSENDYNGPASCILAVSDIHGRDTITLEVDVTPVNDAPKVISYTPAEEIVRVIEGRDQIFSIIANDVDSDFTTEWFLGTDSILTSDAPNSEVTFFSNTAGNYIIKALVSDYQYETEKLWNVIVGPISDFTCSEVGGYVCAEDRTCSGAFLGVKDSDVCCPTECIPKFEDADSCEVFNQDFTLEITEINDNEDIELGDTIRVEIDITNNLPEDQDSVDIEIHLYNLDSDNSEFEIDTDAEVREGRTRTIRLDLEVSEDLDLDDSYAIFAKASDEECAQDYSLIEIKRPDENVAITKFDMPTSATCGETIIAEIRAENLGSEDQDVKMFIESRDLDLDRETSFFELEEYDGEDKETKEFTIPIPEDIEPGTYEVEAMITYNSERVTETREIEIDCRAEQVRQSTLQPSALDERIELNNIEQNQLLGGSSKKSSTIVPIAMLMMFNIILIASVGLLYIVKKKKG